MAIDSYIKLHDNWKLVATYDQPTSSLKDRKEYNKLKKAIEYETIDIIIAYKLDRLARKTLELLNLSELCKKHKVSLVIVGDSINTSTQSGTCILRSYRHLRNLNGNLIIERTKLRLDFVRLNGTKSGKAIGHPRKDIDDQQIVDLKKQGFGSKRIGQIVGLSKRAVQNHLEGLGLKPKLQKVTGVQ